MPALSVRVYVLTTVVVLMLYSVQPSYNIMIYNIVPCQYADLGQGGLHIGHEQGDMGALIHL